MNTNMTPGLLYPNGSQQLSPLDKQQFKALKTIKDKLKGEMIAKK
jgi:hypothetical protein